MFKKYILFISLFSITFTVSAQQFYRSNSLGMALERVSSVQKDNTEYLLEIYNTANITIKTLYKEGLFIKKWELEYSPGGKLKTESVTDDEGKRVFIYKNNRVLSEDIYSGNEILNRIKYFYSAEGKLKAVECYDSNSKLTERKIYEDDSDDKISSVIIEFKPGDPRSFSNYSFTGSDLKSEWQGDSDGNGLFFYYKNGKISFTEKWEENRLVSRTEYIYKEVSLSETFEKYFTENREIVKKFDERRRVLVLTEKTEGKIYKTVYNTYSGNKLVKKIVTSEGDTEKYIYNYNDDELVNELFYLNGIIKKKIYYSSDNEYYEDLYSENKKYMRIYYKDNEKYRVEQ